LNYKIFGSFLKHVLSRKSTLQGENQGTQNLCSLAEKDDLIHFKEDISRGTSFFSIKRSKRKFSRS